MTITSPATKSWYGEPAALKGLLGTVLTVALALVNGQTDTNSAILTVLTVLVPLLTGLWTRRSVTPVTTTPATTPAAPAATPAPTSISGE